MTVLLALSVALLAGLMMSRVTKIWNLPAVTAYLVAGILIGPYCLGRLGITGLGFVSAEDVSQYSIISEVALGFIALAMGIVQLMASNASRAYAEFREGRVVDGIFFGIIWVIFL